MMVLPVAETDLYIAGPTGPISLNLAGHHAILDTSGPDQPNFQRLPTEPTSKRILFHRARREFNITGDVANVNITGGIVTLTGTRNPFAETVHIYRMYNCIWVSVCVEELTLRLDEGLQSDWSVQCR